MDVVHEKGGDGALDVWVGRVLLLNLDWLELLGVPGHDNVLHKGTTMVEVEKKELTLEGMGRDGREQLKSLVTAP